MPLDAAQLRYTSAPLIDASSLPMRLLWARHGTTCVHTEMIDVSRLLADDAYRDFRLNDLRIWNVLEVGVPLVCQLGTCNVQEATMAARMLEPYVDGFGPSGASSKPSHRR
jgi:tRNA-dihydrouridine synthase